MNIPPHEECETGRTFMDLADASRVVHWYVVLHELAIELFLLQIREFLLELILYGVYVMHGYDQRESYIPLNLRGNYARR